MRTGRAMLMTGLIVGGPWMFVGPAAGEHIPGQPVDVTTTTAVPTALCVEGQTFSILESGTRRKLKVKGKTANVRALPGVECEILATFKRGKRLRTTGGRATADQAVWLEVTGKFGIGWIWEGLVRDA